MMPTAHGIYHLTQDHKQYRSLKIVQYVAWLYGALPGASTWVGHNVMLLTTRALEFLKGM